MIRMACILLASISFASISSNRANADFCQSDQKATNGCFDDFTIRAELYKALQLNVNLPTQMVVTDANSGNLSATGGKPGYKYSIVSGILPTGLVLNSSTGQISGTPDIVGTFTATFRVTDDRGIYTDATQAVEVLPKSILRQLSGGNGTVALQDLFTAAEWTHQGINKTVELPAGQVRGYTASENAVVTIGSAWRGDLTFNVKGEIQGKSGNPNGGVGGNAFNANTAGQSGQKLNLVVSGAIRAGGGGGGMGGSGGRGGNGVFGTYVREPASGELYSPVYDMRTWQTWDAGGIIIYWGDQWYMGNHPTVNTIDGWTYYRGSHRHRDTYSNADLWGIWRERGTQQVSTGGSGGSGGAGGRGQGYTLSLLGGSGGSLGTAGGQNAGNGGSGGAGGSGGGWGASGASGISGNPGANGNNGSGTSGSGGSGGGPAGFAIQNPGNVIRSGGGAVQGR